MKADILIVGGGVIGLSIARELHRRGAGKIAVIERGRCGEEASWAAAGMLGPQAEADEAGAFFDMTLASRDLYPDLAAQLLNETEIDIELDRSGTMSLAFTDEDAAELLQRYRWQRDASLAVELLSQEEVMKAISYVSSSVQMGVFFPGDWQVDNRKLLAALKHCAETNGIEIRENTTVEKLLVDRGKVTGVETNSGTLAADKTVLATGAWTSLIQLGDVEMPFKVEPIRGQMICLRPERRLFEYVINSRRGYIVPRLDGRVLAGSTSEKVGFNKAVTDDATDSLHSMATEISPFLSSVPVAGRWSGLRPFAGDGLPIIGEIKGRDGLLIATAHYRNGILLAPLTAQIVADRIVDGAEPLALRTFGPDRFAMQATASN